MSSSRLAVVLVLAVQAVALGAWADVYDDAPVSLRLESVEKGYAVGDTFRLRLTATNASDRPVLLRRDWREQLVFYHLHPTTGEQVEWPGRVRIATRVDLTDLVVLAPGRRHVVEMPVRVFIAEDAATFDFRAKLVGPKDLNGAYAMWQGHAWSNPIRVTVSAK